MKIFLDTAEVDQIIDGYKTGLVDGVTTNPTLILRSGRDQQEVIEEIYQACPNLESISAEVVADTADEMIEQAHLLLISVIMLQSKYHVHVRD